MMTVVNVLDAFRDEALRSGVPGEDIERWLPVARPCVTLSTGNDGPVAASLGGQLTGVRSRFPFVASVDCAAIPAGATDLPLPTEGTLLFFAAPDGLISGYSTAAEVRYAAADVAGGQALHLSTQLSLPG